MKVEIPLILFWFIHIYIHEDNGEIICDNGEYRRDGEGGEDEIIDIT